MSEWKEIKLKEVLNFGNGKVKPNKEGKIPIYGGNGILGYGDDFNYDGETIIIGRVGAYCGSVYYENNPIWVSDNALSAKPKDDNNAKFLYYFLKHINLNQHAGGSSHPLVTQTLLNSLEFETCINPFEQRAIASILSSLDDKIDLLHRQNQTLEKMAETLFKQWFVEETEEDWVEGTLADLANFFNGKQRPNEMGTIPIYGGNGILGFTNISNYKGKSIIVGRVGAYCGILYYENKEIWVSDNALLVKAKNENQTHFLFYLLKTLDLNSMAEGSSHPLLTQTLLKSIQINIPAKEKIQLFDNQVEHFRNKTELNTTQIRTLSTLRDTLLPKLMSGEVRVEIV